MNRPPEPPPRPGRQVHPPGSVARTRRALRDPRFRAYLQRQAPRARRMVVGRMLARVGAFAATRSVILWSLGAAFVVSLVVAFAVSLLVAAVTGNDGLGDGVGLGAFLVFMLGFLVAGYRAWRWLKRRVDQFWARHGL